MAADWAITPVGSPHNEVRDILNIARWLSSVGMGQNASYSTRARLICGAEVQMKA